MMPLHLVQESISRGYSHATCQDIHGSTCNAFCFNYLLRVTSNTYKTYGAVYLVQLLFKLKKIAKKYIAAYRVLRDRSSSFCLITSSLPL